MKNSIVNELINEMKERIAPKETLANFLTNTLCMGKEAVYRRLRGEVAFTFDEVAVISHKLGISIDHNWQSPVKPGYIRSESATFTRSDRKLL